MDLGEQLILHRPWLERVLRCRLSTEDAEDVMQELALAVLPHKSPPSDSAEVAPWLYRMAIRKVINKQRSLHRQRGLQERVAIRSCHAERNGESSLAEPVSWLLRQEASAAMRAAMAQLAARDREILTLKYTQDWTYAQLAQHLGASEKTIEYRLLRAKKNLALLMNAWRPDSK